MAAKIVYGAPLCGNPGLKCWKLRIIAIFVCPVQPSAAIRASSVKNWGFFCDRGVPGATLWGDLVLECQKLRKKLRFFACPNNPLRRSGSRVLQNEGKLPNIVKNNSIFASLKQPFAAIWASSIKHWGKIVIFACPKPSWQLRFLLKASSRLSCDMYFLKLREKDLVLCWLQRDCR